MKAVLRTSMTLVSRQAQRGLLQRARPAHLRAARAGPGERPLPGQLEEEWEEWVGFPESVLQDRSWVVEEGFPGWVPPVFRPGAREAFPA
jgi:hypothetical protein